jgi:alkylated DNA repair dioxygenase AlkB
MTVRFEAILQSNYSILPPHPLQIFACILFAPSDPFFFILIKRMDEPLGYEELEEGLVIYRGFLKLDEQLLLLKMMPSLRLKDSHGEWNTSDNRGNKRGRSYSRINDLPPEIKEIGQRAKDTIETMNEKFKYEEFSHLLVNAYPGKSGMAWHQDDIGKHDGERGAPVYIQSLGNDALFCYRITPKGEDKRIILRSGDLLVFTWPLRLMYHCVKEVFPNTFNERNEMNICDARYSLTYRTTVNLTEEDYMAAQTEIYNQKREELAKKSRSERKKIYQASMK